MTARRTEWVFFIVLLLALLRHVLLACYVHPYADDLSYATAGMEHGLVERLGREYDQWNGRYFSNVFVLRGPMTLGLERGLFWYRLVPIGMIALTWIGAYRLLRELFFQHITRIHAALGSLILLLVYLNAMPDASEGFYWYTGAVSYQFSGALILILAAEWIAYFRTRDARTSILRSMFMALLVIVIAGCNELHMAIMVIAHIALLLWRRWTTGKWEQALIIFFMIAIACAALVALAPGNAVRGAHFPMKHDLINTVAMSALQTGRFVSIWIFTSALFAVSLMFSAWHRNMRMLTEVVPKLCSTNKWLVAALPLSVVFLSMLLPYWSTGLLGQYRTVNAGLLLFLPLWFYALSVWETQVFGKYLPEVTKKHIRIGLVVVVLLFFAMGRDGSVTMDLLDGSAARYDREMQDRFARIEKAVLDGDEELTIPKVDQPKSLVITQLSPDPIDWKNRSMAQYFGNGTLQISVE